MDKNAMNIDDTATVETLYSTGKIKYVARDGETRIVNLKFESEHDYMQAARFVARINRNTAKRECCTFSTRLFDYLFKLRKSGKRTGVFELTKCIDRHKWGELNETDSRVVLQRPLNRNDKPIYKSVLRAEFDNLMDAMNHIGRSGDWTLTESSTGIYSIKFVGGNTPNGKIEAAFAAFLRKHNIA